MSFRLVPKSVTLNDLEVLNGVMALFCVISANSGRLWAHCVKVHVRYISSSSISWWVLVCNLIDLIINRLSVNWPHW